MINCSICGSSDQWQNVDSYRNKTENMCICMKCGFVTYPDIIAKSEDLKEFYRAEYREAPTVAAVHTGQRKLHYHGEFLKDLFDQWRKQDLQNPDVFEVGSAIGMFLKFVKDNFPHANISGTELTKTYRRIAQHCYGVKLQEEFDASKKYDLIASYKVAEHIPYIEKELRKYAECLKESGFLYISVPIWFKTMHNFGVGGFSLDYYYHKNHINSWSRKLFETLLKKCGLEVVKENHVFYDSTYLCKRNDALMSLEPQYENPVEILDQMDRIKKAAKAADAGDFETALNYWPDFPEAWINSYELKRADWHKKGFQSLKNEYMDKAMEACPEAYSIRIWCADLCLRYNQFDLALQYLDISLKMKPQDANSLIALASCYRQMADQTPDPEAKVHFFKEARDVTKHVQQISFEHQSNAVSWLFADCAKIPLDDETAAEVFAQREPKKS